MELLWSFNWQVRGESSGVAGSGLQEPDSPHIRVCRLRSQRPLFLGAQLPEAPETVGNMGGWLEGLEGLGI